MSRATWTASLKGSLWPVAFAVLANAPGRYAMATRERQFGRDLTTTLAMAVLADIACLGPLFALFLAPSDWLAARRREERAPRAALVTSIATVVLVALFMWTVSVGATEFWIQRGSYPALVETLEGLGDPTFIRGSARIALFERYSWPTLVALLALIGVLVAYGRARLGARGASSSALSAAVGPAVGSLGWAGCAAVLLLLIRGIAPASTSHGLIPPLIRLAADARAPRPADRIGGVRAVLESIHLGEPTVRSGLHWLGFGDAHAQCLLMSEATTSCAPHPLARPLPGDVTRADVPDARREEPTPLVRGFLALSSALFDQRETPLTVWHLALESFRADDIHALHAAAPPEIAPFVNAAYEQAERGGLRTVAFHHAYQSGLRTAQAVSGLWCGLGALPFQLALSRDLIDLPVRCAPDVLRDAGFETHLYYGSNATFEHLGEFASRHGMGLTDLSTLPPDLPRGAFRAVTDDALLRIALRDSDNAGSLSYRFVLTLSGHSPFDLPEDVSPTTQTSVGNAISEHFRAPIAAEDSRRLVTMAYTDRALAAFVREIESSPRANQTILLASADHATADPFLWGQPTSHAMAKVPLFFYLPAAFIASSRDPGRVEEELRSLGTLASTLAVSVDDVPTLLLALLAKHHALQHLAPELRWHTLGGATSSSHFASSAATTAQVWGIDAFSRVFVVRADAVEQLFDTGEQCVAFSVWNEPLGPVLKDVTGALSALLRACSEGYAASTNGKRCCATIRQ